MNLGADPASSERRVLPLGWGSNLRSLPSAESTPRTFAGSSEQRFEQVFTAAPVACALVSLDGRIMNANPALCSLVQAEENALIGKVVCELIHPDDRRADITIADPVSASSGHGHRREVRFLRSSREPGWALVAAAIARNREGTPLGVVVQFFDITDHKVVEQRLRHQASHDALTQLWNRARMMEELDRFVSEHRRYGHPGALILVDLDSFKAVNDRFGHDEGDRLLRAAADAIRAATRASDCCARLGGDEFVVMLPFSDEEAAVSVGNRIVGKVGAIRGLQGRQCVTRASAGLAVLGEGAQTGAEWLSQADRAMYRAKQAGGNRMTL